MNKILQELYIGMLTNNIVICIIMIAKTLYTEQYWKIVILEVFLIVTVMALVEEIRGLK